MSVTLPSFNFSVAVDALSRVPKMVLEDLPSVIAYGACEVGGVIFHGWLENMGYKGVLPLAFANGVTNTAKFSYYNACGNQPTGSTMTK